MININRRRLLATTAAAALLATAAVPAFAQAQEVEIGVIAPLSGPWARLGELLAAGAQQGVDDINAAGGIKALGGAKLKLVVFDTGDSVEKAKNAAQLMVSNHPNLTAATGCVLSSFTLAVTEVTERAELPFLTYSYSDQVVARGFKYVFKTSPTSGQLASGALPTLVDLAEKATGKKPATIGIVGDNTASPVSFTKPMREGGIAALGMEIVVDEVYTPPLADATSLIQQVRARRPELLLMLATTISDDKLILEKLTEFGLGGGKIPVIANGTHIGSADLAKTMDHAALEGVMSIVANWGGKGQEELTKAFQERTGLPWLTEDFLSTYGDMWIFKEALEAAASPDRNKVADAIRSMDTTEGPAKFYPGGRVKFDETGLRVGAELVIYQWQNGVPVTVFPESSATARLKWPTP
jgi:branched-chain amino acid transport system substrate-binding protein